MTFGSHTGLWEKKGKSVLMGKLVQWKRSGKEEERKPINRLFQITENLKAPILLSEFYSAYKM